MVRSERPDSAAGQQSLGDLVAGAVKDISQLVRYEINLAVSEAKTPGPRARVRKSRKNVSPSLIRIVRRDASSPVATSRRWPSSTETHSTSSSRICACRA